MNFGTLAPPVLSSNTGTFIGAVNVMVSSAQPGALIRYLITPGGSVSTSSPLYTGPITLSTTTTVRARAYHPDYASSTEASAVFTVQASAPTLSLASGAYAPGTAVTITGDPATTMRYTLDGIDPTTSAPIVASGTRMPLGSFTLKVRAFLTGASTSAVAAASYALTGALGPGGMRGSNQHVVLVTPLGRVWTWGENFGWQLGDGAVTNYRVTPWLVPEVTGATAVAAGSYHTVTLRSDGRIVVWGNNGSGQLGDGTTTSRSRPTLVPSLTEVVAIEAGAAHTLALTSSGQVFAWGSNAHGQLGDASTTNSSVPKLVTGLPEVVAIAAGGEGHSSYAVTPDGHLYAWGLNSYGQLGDGTTVNRTSPTLVAGLQDVEQVSAGSWHAVARLRSGQVFSWGIGGNGALGLGDTTNRSTPTRITGLQAAGVWAGYNTGMAATTSGQLVGWGFNQSGQLGDGTYADRLSPTPVQGVTDALSFFVQRSAGVVTASGDVWTFGSSGYGKLGDGSVNSARAVPQVIVNIPEPWAPAAAIFSVAPGTYTAPFTLVVSTPMPGAVIRYTVDGSTPTEADAEAVNGEIFINANVTVRARVFAAGRAPSAITAGAYVITP